MKLLVVAGWLLIAAAPVHAQEAAFASRAAAGAREATTITAARDLYASARYEEALALLNGLRPAELSDARDVRTVEQYRSLCLLALGRHDEAATAIAALVTADPFYQPGESEAAPRVRATFADVRQRLLPNLASERYATAKATYDRKQYADAERQFRDLLRLLDDPQMKGRLPDLRLLAAGFVELASAAAAPPPPPPAADVPATAETPKESSAPSGPRVYSSQDEEVKGPVAVRQDVPPVPASVTNMARDRAVLELVIDEEGRVASIALRMRAHPVYDAMLLNAAKDWRYRPATLNGTPVRYRKMLQVSISRR